jgi:hypothetical protein
MWCFANDKSVRDFYAHIEGTFNYGRFTKVVKVVYEDDDG